MIFLDSNVLIDLSRTEDRWHSWSVAVLRRHLDAELIASPVVLAEISARFETLDLALIFLSELTVRIDPIDERTAFVAGQAHRAYRRSGGAREAILADFLIGAHAQTLGATLVTRDRARFSTHFPTLTLITPETHP